MLDKPICHFRGIKSILSIFLLFYFWWQILLANTVDPDLMPHYVASDLGLHCLSLTLLRFPGKNRFKMKLYKLNPKWSTWKPTNRNIYKCFFFYIYIYIYIYIYFFFIFLQNLMYWNYIIMTAKIMSSLVVPKAEGRIMQYISMNFLQMSLM